MWTHAHTISDKWCWQFLLPAPLLYNLRKLHWSQGSLHQRDPVLGLQKGSWTQKRANSSAFLWDNVDRKWPKVTTKSPSQAPMQKVPCKSRVRASGQRNISRAVAQPTAQQAEITACNLTLTYQICTQEQPWSQLAQNTLWLAFFLQSTLNHIFLPLPIL